MIYISISFHFQNEANLMKNTFQSQQLQTFCLLIVVVEIVREKKVRGVSRVIEAKSTFFIRIKKKKIECERTVNKDACYAY